MTSCLTDNVAGMPAAGIAKDTRFPDPFCDIASMHMPTTIQSALYWCEFLLEANGVYREALRRIVSYFITDVEIVEDGKRKVGKEERDKYLTFLNDTLGIKNVLHQVAMDYLTYGNSFTSVIMPFRRALSCKGCGFEAPIRKVYNTPQFAFAWQDFDFHATCPRCKYRGAWRHIDRRSGESEDVRVKRWRPQELDLLWDPLTDDITQIWKIPDEYRTMLRRGKLHHLERASWEVIQAVKGGQNLMFDKDVVYHMKEETLAGIRSRGWGLSRVLTNFRQAWYVQILQRYNEAIALDYVIPFRVLTPESTGDSDTDPVHRINLAGFVGRVNGMLNARKRDPARWNVLPFSIDYKALGGEAADLAPTDLINQGMDTLLTSIGVPVEFYKGSMNIQAAPVALRLLEANWSHLVHNLNIFINKLVTRVARLMGWEPVHARLIRVTHADDLNRQMAKLQLMMGNQISKTTGLGSVGLDYDSEIRRMLEESRIEAEEQQRMQEEMEQGAQMQEYINTIAPDITTQAVSALQGASGGAPAPGAAAAPAGAAQAGAMGQSAVDQFTAQRINNPNVPITPEEMQAQADTIASDLMSKQPQARKSELSKLRKSDQTMHALVTSIMENMRQQAASQGQQMVLDQQFGKTAAPKPPPVIPSDLRPRRFIDLG